MIGVKLQGGLGNQLFQYAFAISTVRKLKTFYVIDDLRNPDRFLKYFRRMSLTDFAFIRTALLKYFRRSKPKTLKQSSSDANHLFLLKMANHIYYEGFFQSVDFFKDVSGLLKDKIRLRSEYRKQFDEKYGQ